MCSVAIYFNFITPPHRALSLPSPDDNHHHGEDCGVEALQRLCHALSSMERLKMLWNFIMIAMVWGCGGELKGLLEASQQLQFMAFFLHYDELSSRVTWNLIILLVAMAINCCGNWKCDISSDSIVSHTLKSIICNAAMTRCDDMKNNFQTTHPTQKEEWKLCNSSLSAKFQRAHTIRTINAHVTYVCDARGWPNETQTQYFGLIIRLATIVIVTLPTSHSTSLGKSMNWHNHRALAHKRTLDKIELSIILSFIRLLLKNFPVC